MSAELVCHRRWGETQANAFARRMRRLQRAEPGTVDPMAHSYECYSRGGGEGRPNFKTTVAQPDGTLTPLDLRCQLQQSDGNLLGPTEITGFTDGSSATSATLLGEGEYRVFPSQG